MEDHIKEKIAKVYELVRQGVDGEKSAAKLALDRILKKYNIENVDFEKLRLKEYRFKYSTTLEMYLLTTICDYFLKDKKIEMYRDLRGVRDLVLELEYIDFIVVDSAYEYFRRHMKKEYNRLIVPKIKRCRTARTKKIRREELQPIFFSRYVIASKLYHSDQLKKVDTSTLSKKELQDRIDLEKVQGGSYKTQVTTGLYLE